MFYGKKIKQLEFEIEKLSFKLNNPPKYPIGSRCKKGMVISGIIYKHSFGVHVFSSWYNRFFYITYEFTDIKTGKKALIDDYDLEKFINPKLN